MVDKIKRTYKPEKQTIRLNERLLPDLKDIDVGATVTISVKVKMISKSEGSEYGGLYCDDGEDSPEYSKAREADQNQLKGTFEVLEADDHAKSKEQEAADKIMADRKRGRTV